MRALPRLPGSSNLSSVPSCSGCPVPNDPGTRGFQKPFIEEWSLNYAGPLIVSFGHIP